MTEFKPSSRSSLTSFIELLWYLDKMPKSHMYFHTKFRTNNLCKVNQLCGCELPFYHLENSDLAIILTMYTVGLFTLILQIFMFAEFSTLERI